MPQIHHYKKEAPAGALFSILIPSWNNLPYLKLCIQSILQNSRYPHQIIIHVNEGKDGTLDWVRSENYAFTHSEENVGVCYALNHMTGMASTPYILYLNDDMFVAPHWDAYLYEAIEARPDDLFYFSGTMVEYEDTGNKAVLSPFDFGKSHDTFQESAFTAFAAQAQKADWFGSCWPPSIVSKRLWDLAGGYDIAYTPGFYSDPDFAMKLWQLGVRDFRGIGKSLVYHFKCKSTGRVIRNDGRKTFAQKWGIPSSFFYKKVLRMGQPVSNGISLHFPDGPLLWIAKLKALLISKGYSK